MEDTKRKDFIRAYAEKNQMSVRAWEDKSKLSRETIWSWANHKRENFSTKTMVTLAEELETTIDVIMKL